MNVTIIYGTMIKAITYTCVQLLLNSLMLKMNIKVTEFFLQDNLSYLSPKHFPYLTTHNNTCTHVDPILQSLNEADLIILACPVFSCDITPEMNSFLNNISYRFMQPKTNSLMHNKIGLVMSTTPGAGLFYAINNLKRNLSFWGMYNIFKFSETLYEMNWNDVNIKRKKQINRKISSVSNKIFNTYSKSQTTKVPIIFNKITSFHKEFMFKENHFTVINFDYYKKQFYNHIRNI